jgi:hypothetical protein
MDQLRWSDAAASDACSEVAMASLNALSIAQDARSVADPLFR